MMLTRERIEYLKDCIKARDWRLEIQSELDELFDLALERLALEPRKELTNEAKAYALLWRSTTDDKFAIEARHQLLGSVPPEQRKEGIMWLIKTFGEISTSEMIAADCFQRNPSQRCHMSDELLKLDPVIARQMQELAVEIEDRLLTLVQKNARIRELEARVKAQNEALERLGSTEAFTVSFMPKQHLTETQELNARIDYARAAATVKGEV